MDRLSEPSSSYNAGGKYSSVKPHDTIGISQSKNSKSKPWNARLWINGRKTHIGSYPTWEAAALAYDRRTRELRGETAKTNFSLEEFLERMDGCGGKIATYRDINKQFNTSSRYIGVSWNKYHRKWQCYYKHMFIGLFSDETDAARAFDVIASKATGGIVRLNFPADHNGGTEVGPQSIAIALSDQSSSTLEQSYAMSPLYTIGVSKYFPPQDFDSNNCHITRHHKILIILALAIVINNDRSNEQLMLQEKWSEIGKIDEKIFKHTDASLSTPKKNFNLISHEMISLESGIKLKDKKTHFLAEYYSIIGNKDRDAFVENLYCHWESVTTTSNLSRTFDEIFDRLVSIIGIVENRYEALLAKVLEFVRRMIQYSPMKCSPECSISFKKYLVNKISKVLKLFTAQEYASMDQNLWGAMYDHLGVITQLFSESVMFLNNNYVPDVCNGEMTIKQWILAEIIDINSTARSFPLVTNAFVILLKKLENAY